MRVLLVEGQEDLRVVPWMVAAAGIPWGDKHSPIVKIHAYEGVGSLLAAGEIETHLKTSRLAALGVMVDADDSASARWDAIRARVSNSYPEAPVNLPAEGVVIHRADAPSFGVWVMPDNSSRGMLETFLLHLRPTENTPLLNLSAQVTSEARSLGAPFISAHEDKAQIHSWLAWQNPPGRQLHNAVMENMLVRRSPEFVAFIDWFRALYRV